MATIVFDGHMQLPALQERDPNTTAPPQAGEHNDSSQKTVKKTTKSSQLMNTSTQTKNSLKRSTEKPPSAADLSHIHLDGEEDEKVSIFDTCDDIRKKIKEHLKLPGVTQASLARELSEMMPQTKVQPRQVAKFLNFKGPRAGGHSPVFYAGYVFFEKLRLQQDKKKTKKREDLEETWERKGGFPREGSHNKHCTLTPGQSWRINYLGCVDIKEEPNPTRRGGLPLTRRRPTK